LKEVIMKDSFLPQANHAQEGPKEATEWTVKANRAVLTDLHLNWADQEDFENARQGFIARHFRVTIANAKGSVVFDMEAYTAFIKPDAPAPDTVNPSLWPQILMSNGLPR
jgi:alkyl sulfatase BDS1-like metallo-beta-lactamase superfamily hydrolase